MPRCFKKSLSSLLPHVGHSLFPSSVFVAAPKSKDGLKEQSTNVPFISSASTETIEPIPSTSFHQTSADNFADVAAAENSQHPAMEDHDKSDVEAGYATINEKPNSNQDEQSSGLFKKTDHLRFQKELRIEELYAKPRGKKSLGQVNTGSSEGDDSKSEENVEISQIDDNSYHQLPSNDQLQKNLNALHILKTINNDISEKQGKRAKVFKSTSDFVLPARSESSILIVPANTLQLRSKSNVVNFQEHCYLIKQQVKKLQKELLAWESFRLTPSDIDVHVLHQLKAVFKELYKNQKQSLNFLEQNRLDLEKNKSFLISANDELDDLHQTKADIQKEKHQISDTSEIQEEIDNLHQQLSDLAEENHIYKDTIHRLNVELSCYQSEFRRLSPEELQNINSPLSEKDPIPPWLINVKYLSPLFFAYDDKMQKKEDIICTYEKELKNFQLRVEELINENESLHKNIRESSSETTVDKAEWKHLLEQAQLVIAENEILMEEIDISYTKMKEMHENHVHHVTKLGQHLEEIKNDKVSLERSDKHLKNSYTDLKEKNNHLKALLKNSIAIEEYEKEKKAYERLIAELKSGFKKENEISLSKLKFLQLEQKKLVTQLADLQVEKNNLQDKIKSLSKAYRYSQQKETSLEEQLQSAAEEAAVTQKYLSEVLQMVDQMSAERHIYVKLAKEQHDEALQMMEKIIQGTLTRNKLEEKLKHFKIRTVNKISKATKRLKEQNDHLHKQRTEFEEEIRHLQYLVKIKQEKVASLLSEKRQIEENLEVIWKLATSENKQIQKKLEESLLKASNDSEEYL